MRRRRRVVLALASATTLFAGVACNAILGNEEPRFIVTDGSAEAGADVGADVRAEATLDAPESDALPATGCVREPDATFCDDFDDGRFRAEWRPSVGEDAGLTIASPGDSPPSALFARVTSYIDTAPSIEILKLQKSGKKVRVALSVRADQLDRPGFGFACVAAYGPDGVSAKHHLRIMITSTSTFVQEYLPDAAAFPLATGGPLPIGQWARITMTVDYALTPPEVKLVVDGATLGTDRLTAGFPEPNGNGVAAGLHFTGPKDGGAWAVGVDDFVLDITP